MRVLVPRPSPLVRPEQRLLPVSGYGWEPTPRARILNVRNGMTGRDEKFGALPAATLETPEVTYETHFTSGQCGGGFLLEEQRQIVPEQP